MHNRAAAWHNILVQNAHSVSNSKILDDESFLVRFLSLFSMSFLLVETIHCLLLTILDVSAFGQDIRQLCQALDEHESSGKIKK